MEFLIVKLDPETRDELYADINPNLVDFVLLEAITLAGKEMINNPDAMLEATGDEVYHLNDPEIDMNEAIQAILDVMVETDKLAGIDTTADDYDPDEKHDFISEKLVLALSSITFANKVGEVLMFHSVISNPKFAQGVHVKGTHLGNVATLSLTPLAEAAQTVVAVQKAVEQIKEQMINDLHSHIKKG